MTQLTTIKGVELQIMIGDGASPEVFEHPCMINTDRGVAFETSGQDDEIPDCDDPTGMAWNRHTKTSIKGTISGAGKLDADPESISMFWDWLIADEAKNVQITYGAVGGTITGTWKLTQFGQTGKRGTVAEVTLTMISDGEQVFAPPVP